MILSLIAGMARHRVIGINNELPWRLPADLAWFKKNTLSKPIIMGYKTYLSIGRPLPGRQNIVLSRQSDLIIEGCDVANSVDEAITLCGCASEAMVIGGEIIYQLFILKADRLYLTQVDAEIAGDAFFPEYQKDDWSLVFEEHHQADERNQYNYTFQKLVRS